MMNIHFKGAKDIGKPESMTDEQCSSAWAMPFTQEIDVVLGDLSTEKQPVQCWLMCYQPSHEDKQAIAAGGPVWLKIMAPQLVPHALFTQNPNTGEFNV